jgi:chromate transport protein ChrA
LPWLRGFGKGAAPAAIGLLGVAAVSLARTSFTSWPYLVIAAIALIVSLWRKLNPLLILIGGLVCGTLIGTLGW